MAERKQTQASLIPPSLGNSRADRDDQFSNCFSTTFKIATFSPRPLFMGREFWKVSCLYATVCSFNFSFHYTKLNCHLQRFLVSSTMDNPKSYIDNIFSDCCREKGNTAVGSFANLEAVQATFISRFWFPESFSFVFKLGKEL